MAHFYSNIKGGNSEATRCGSKSSGVSAYVQGWTGSVETNMSFDKTTDRDLATITLDGGPRGSYGRVCLTPHGIDVAAIMEASEFDAQTNVLLQNASRALDRANRRAARALQQREARQGRGLAS
jgi:hypothetical protein